MDGLRAGQGQSRSDWGGEAFKRNSDVDLSAQKDFCMDKTHKMSADKIKALLKSMDWFI